MERVDRQSTEMRMDALERRIAKLESQLQPLGATCPKCRAFGFRYDSAVPRTGFGGKKFANDEMQVLRLYRGKIGRLASAAW